MPTAAILRHALRQRDVMPGALCLYPSMFSKTSNLAAVNLIEHDDAAGEGDPEHPVAPGRGKGEQVSHLRRSCEAAKVFLGSHRGARRARRGRRLRGRHR